MKKTTKKLIALLLCVAMLMGIMSVVAYAESARDYSRFNYKYYTYIGDSVSWGYGLDWSYDPLAADSMFKRIKGGFTDIVGTVLEENCGAEVHSAACNGGRLCDYRMLLERGMGVETPYTYPDDIFGYRSYERTVKLQNSGEYVCDNLKKSDLITMTLGANDLASCIINVAGALDFIDIERIQALDSEQSKLDYAVFAIEAAIKQKNMLADFCNALKNEIAGLKENQREVIKDIVELAPDNADILVVGYFIPFNRFRLLPGSDSSPLLEMLGTAFSMFNDSFEAIASEYSNVYYVDAPEASVFFEDGTMFFDALTSIVNDKDSFLLGIHPDAEGQKYISERVLDKLVEINTCHHTHTKTVYESSKSKCGYGYVGNTVCTDCGKVLDAGKIVTPDGNINVPVRTITYTVSVIEKAVSNTVNKLKSAITSIFKR